MLHPDSTRPDISMETQTNTYHMVNESRNVHRWTPDVSDSISFLELPIKVVKRTALRK